MGKSAKDLVIKVIPSGIANKFMRRHHYSGKVVNNSSLHFGVFMGGVLSGVMSYGSPLDKSKVLGLVGGTGWNEMIELNRMAFNDRLPKNSESRAISQSIKLLKKNAPHIKWILSFADATECGDGTIYRASNFLLTDIKENKNIAMLPDGTKIHKMTLESNPTAPRKELGGRSYYDITGAKYDFGAYCRHTNAKVLVGYQLRYIYIIDKKSRKKLNAPSLPYSMIDEMGAGMYMGEKVTAEERREAGREEQEKKDSENAETEVTE